MKRSRNSQPTLKHLAFFEVLAGCGEESAVGRASTAGLLSLRLIDHWILAGAQMVQPESVSVRSVRNAIMAMPAHEPLREALFGIVNTMQTLREVDMQRVLPRLAAYASLLERRSEYKLAADVYETVIRLGEEEFDGDVVVDAYLRFAYCSRVMGALEDAERAYLDAGRIAKRTKEVSRALRSRIGLANVSMVRGNLPKADELLQEICLDSEKFHCKSEMATALHSRAVIAQRRGNVSRAVCFAYDALKLTPSPSEKDRVLGDIAAFLIVQKRFDAARDALMILDATTTGVDVRTNVRVNLAILEARAGNRQMFEEARAQVPARNLPAETEVNYLIECARGLFKFGVEAEAEALLASARAKAEAFDLNRSVFEIDEVLARRGVIAHENDGSLETFETPTEYVERGLREMAAALAS